MANEITGASLSPIYNRLNGVPEYHPLEADTFSDWSMEAGDVVTVTRDGKEYKSPVHSSKITWKGGAPMVSVNATGNEEREAVAKASKKKYGRGSSGLRNSERTYQEIITSYNNMTAGLILASSSAALFVEDKYSQMKSGLDLTSSSASLYVENKYSQMKSGLDLTSSSAALYVNSKYDQMSSGLNLTSSSAALYVNSKYDQMTAGLKLTSSTAALYVNGKTSKAQLLLSINGAGHSDAYLEADNITLDGSTKMTDTLTIENGGLKVSKAATFLQDVTLTGTGATVHSTNYQLYSGGKVKFNASTQGGSEVAVGYDEFDTMIIKAAVSGNVLKLWKRGESTSSDPALTFSKATSVSGAWSGEGNEQKWVVTATQNGEVVGGRSIGFGGGPTVRLRLGTNGTPEAVTGNSKVVSAPVHVYTNDSEGGGTVTHDRYTTKLTIDGSIPYANGRTYGQTEIKDAIHRIGIALPVVEDTGYYKCTVYNASSGTIKTLDASYDAETPANSTGVRVPLLANASITSNGSHSPNTANYLGYKSVSVNVGASLNSCNYVNSTPNLPSGTKVDVTTTVKSVITNNWSIPGYIYWRFNVGGTYYVFYTSTKGS